MRKSYLIVIVIFIISLLFTTGCTIRHGDFTVVSNKVCRLSEFELDKVERVKGIEGKDVQHTLIFFATGGPPSLEGALDDAFAKGNGDVMTDAVIETWSFYLPLLYGQTGWSVKGDVVKTRKN